MPRFVQGEIIDSELDNTSQTNIKNNILISAENEQPVTGVILPKGDVGIIKNGNVILPISTEGIGTINQDGNLILYVKSNIDGATLYINGENTFKTAPDKLIFTLSDIIKSGEKRIEISKDGYTSNETYIIQVIQNVNFDDTTFDNYKNDIISTDGLFDFKPQAKFFTKTPPHVFRIQYIKDGILQNTDATTDTQEIKELPFTLTQRNLKAEELIKVIDPQTDLANVTIKVVGPNNSVTVINGKSQESTKLIEGTTTLIVEQGTRLSISSTNNSTYRIKSVNVTEIGKKTAPLVAENLDSLTTEYVVNADTTFDIESETLSIVAVSTPLIKIPDEGVRKYNINSETGYTILFTSQNVTSVDVYIKDKTFNFPIEGDGIEKTNAVLIPKTVFDSIGNYKIYIVGKNASTESTPIDYQLSVVNEFYIKTPDITTIKYPKELRGGDYKGTDVDFEIEYSSTSTDFVRIYINNSTQYVQYGPNDKIKFNVESILKQSGYNGPLDNIKINLKLVPHNISGTKEIIGKEELLLIDFFAGNLTIPKQLAINRIAAAFTSQFDESLFSLESAKYLNHLLHIGNGDNKLITTWTGSLDSLIVKLYEPLPTTIQTNQLVWISKPQSTPIIETISLLDEVIDVCNPIKGPNFSIQPDNGIEFQIYDDLIASGSESSVSIINKYTNSLGIDTEKLSIEYVSGSEYLFKNFVNFSSATERVENFFYKAKLIEYYKNLESIVYAQPNPSPSELNEAKKNNTLYNNLVINFDGFEKYLYYTTNLESNNLAYPKTNPSSSILLNTSSSLVTNWYYEILQQSENFDKYNPNKLSNNIPSYLIEDKSNEDFVVFLNMIAQHFDLLWVYINGLARAKNLDASNIRGIPNDIVKYLLESHGWDVKNAYNSNFLWEHAFGTYKDGTQKYGMPLKKANEEVWRRILNNLPYILKHKGTSRAMKAILSCYGVPQSMLTIMEFGGPQDPTKGGSTKFTFDDRTAAIYLSSSACVKVPWKVHPGGSDYPNAIEFRFKPDSIPNTVSTLLSGSEWKLDLVQTTGSFGKLELNFGGDQALTTYMETSGVYYPYFDTSIEYVYGPDYKTGSLDFPIYTDYYSNVIVNRYNTATTGSWYTVWLGTSDGTRIINSVSMSIFSTDNQWETGSFVQVGSDTFNGNIDEVRLWKVPLERAKFNNHVLFPDATNGNSYTASTADLLFRLDFEYPKDRNADPLIKNVAINQTYGESYASASQMYTATTYPYQYTPYDRTVTAEVPSLGFGYSNKIRFESASLVTDLSHKTRATKKAFDQAPIDSNRLGLFFSPIKELNMDILKTFGDFNVDNYIGDPRDEYKDTYTELNTLRHYYFERMNQDINEYIQLVRYIDKSLFDVLTDLAPARARVSKGLLIEPHFLERSKTKWKETLAENNTYDTSIATNDDVNLVSDFIPKETSLDASLDTTLIGEKLNYESDLDAQTIYEFETATPFYSSLIDVSNDEQFETSYPTYTMSLEVPNGASLSAEVDSFKFQAIGMERDSLANAGYGLYARNGFSIKGNFDGVFGNYITTHITASVNGGDRKNVYLVKESYTNKVSTQTQGWPATNIPGQQVKYEDLTVTNYKYKVTELPYSGSISVGNNIVEVKPINGYLPTHYRYTNNLTEGLKRSYYKGSQQTSASTPDSLPSVETFTTNPNILRVAKTGRGSGEPILEVD